MLFKIGNKDFTQNIQESTYKVDSEPDYEEIIDANYNKKRFFKRNYINGSFEMAFYKPNEYQNFINALGKQNDIELYVNNLNSNKQITAYIVISGEKHVQLQLTNVDIITVKIEEV